MKDILNDGLEQILTGITIPQKGEKYSPIGGNFGGARGTWRLNIWILASVNYDFSFRSSFVHAQGRSNRIVLKNRALPSRLRGVKTKLRRSQPVFALSSFDAVHLAFHLYSPLKRDLHFAPKSCKVFWRR